jgi:UDP-glucose 4-epimerase
MPFILALTKGNRMLQTLNSFYRNRHVMVAGADGFLGFNCVMKLSRLGAIVSIVTRRHDSAAAPYAHLIFHGDLRNTSLVAAAVAGQSVVFDFAGVCGAVGSNESPQASLEEDCGAQLNLFEACARERDVVVMFCSSRLVYGKPLYLPVDEQHVLAPASIYAVHKITAEHYLAALNRTRGLRYCVLRLSNPYGPFQPDHRRGYSVVNQFIRLACKGGPIIVYGGGEQVRDYIFIDEAIEAFLLCAANEHCYQQTFNVGGRVPISIGAAAMAIARLAGSCEVQFAAWPDNYLAVETGDYVSDLGKLTRAVSLPEPVSFEQGAARSIAYYRQEAAIAPLPELKPVPLGAST